MAKRNAGSTGAGRERGSTMAQSRQGTGPSGDRGGQGSKGGAATPPDPRGDLRGFVREHPQGWGHEEWLELLERLRARGHDVQDPGAIGAALERERLSAMLGAIQGVGAQRVHTLAERYGTIWDLRQADVEDLMHSARIPQPLAERIRSAV